MNRGGWIIFFLLCIANVCAQDEYYIKKMMEGRFQSLRGRPIAPIDNPYFQVRSEAYHYDFNRDGLRESINTLKSDGTDYIEIRDNNGRVFLRKQLPTKGGESNLYKVGIYKISPVTTTLILYFYEGLIDQVNFLATARLYFLTVEKLNWSEAVVFEGPTFFEERTTRNLNYIRRVLKTTVRDLNKDGYRDIMVSEGRINRVFMYLENGRWKRI